MKKVLIILAAVVLVGAVVYIVYSKKGKKEAQTEQVANAQDQPSEGQDQTTDTQAFGEQAEEQAGATEQAAAQQEPEQAPASKPAAPQAPAKKSEVQAIADMINAEIAKEEGLDFKATAQDNNIVLTGELDEEALGGMSVGMAKKMVDAGGDNMIKMMMPKVMEQLGPNGAKIAKRLRDNKSNLILHITGKPSREEAELVVRYDLLPE